MCLNSTTAYSVQSLYVWFATHHTVIIIIIICEGTAGAGFATVWSFPVGTLVNSVSMLCCAGRRIRF